MCITNKNNISTLQTKTLEEIKARLSATAAGSRAPQDFRELSRGILISGGKAARESAGNVRGGIQKVDKFYQEGTSSVVDLMSGKGGLDKVSEVIGNGAKSVEEGLKKMADNFSKFNYTDAAKPYISSGNKIAEGASVAFDGLKKLGDKATAVASGGTKKPAVEKQTNVKPIIYCEKNFYAKYISGYTKKEYPLWLCDYNRRPNMTYSFWQKTDQFKVEGITGNVDFNVFNGNKEQLQQLTID